MMSLVARGDVVVALNPWKPEELICKRITAVVGVIMSVCERERERVLIAMVTRRERRFQLVVETFTSCRSCPEGISGSRVTTVWLLTTLGITDQFPWLSCVAECGTRYVMILVYYDCGIYLI